MTSVEYAAAIMLNDSLAVKEGEKVLIITDNILMNIGEILYNAALDITEAELIEIPVGEVHGEEIPFEVAEEMLRYDVILIPTEMSRTHTKAVKDACKNGARIATLPGITEETIQRAVNVDYYAMAKRTNELKDILDKGKEVRVVSKAGTEIRFSIDGREAEGGSGLLHGKGLFGNLPAGEAFIAPLEGTADGKYVIDGSVLNKKLENPITVIVENGMAVLIEGEEADELIDMLESVNDDNAYNIAEFGIGTNDKAIVCGNTLEDEKVMGTCHIALGKNNSFGGNIDVPIHIDGIILEPTIYIDDEMIMEQGKLVL